MDRNIRLMHWLGEFRSIDVHLDFGREPRKRTPVVTRLPNIQPRTEYQQYIGILHRKVPGPLTDRPRPPAEQLIIRRNQIVRPCGHYWNPQKSDHRIELVERSRKPHPCPRKHDRAFS